MLKPRKRLTRKEIKEDALVTHYVQLQKLYQKYSQQIHVALIAIVVIVAGSIFLVRNQKGAELKAAAQLGMAEPYFHAKQYDRAILELTPVVDSYAGTRAGATAAFYLATACFEQGDFEKALSYFEIAEKKNSDNLMLKVSGAAGRAACYEALSQLEDAARTYEKAGKQYGHHFSSPENLMHAARCYLAVGNRDKAGELYELIAGDYPDSREAGDVEFLKAAL